MKTGRMKVGTLEVEVVDGTEGPLLRVLGRPYGLETNVTVRELMDLAVLLMKSTDGLAVSAELGRLAKGA